jgi:hypothetical protein
MSDTSRFEIFPQITRLQERGLVPSISAMKFVGKMPTGSGSGEIGATENDGSL